jgi:hypothetical protein
MPAIDAQGRIIPQGDISLVAPNLWVGRCPTSETPGHIDHIVALLDGPLPYSPRVHQTLTFAQMIDQEQLPDLTLLESLAALVNWFRARGPTLVHCKSGLNRSALVAGLALIRSGMNPRWTQSRYCMSSDTISSSVTRGTRRFC